MGLSYKSTHVAEALGNYIQKFKGKPRLMALTTAYIEQIQDLEDAFYQLITDRTIETAVGAQLDGIGSIVGEAREGREDEDYRLAIRVRILLNLTNGTIEQVIEILSLATGGKTIHVINWAHGENVLSDGDMEAPSLDAWTDTGNGAVVTKET